MLQFISSHHLFYFTAHDTKPLLYLDMCSSNVNAGSPFIVSVGGQPSGRVRETSTMQVQAAELIVPGQKTHIMLKIPG